MLTKKIRDKFLEYCPDEDLQKWFDPLVFDGPQNGGGPAAPGGPDLYDGQGDPDGEAGRLTVRFPHRLFADWFHHKHREKFERMLTLCLGRQADISYSCPGAFFGSSGQAAPQPAPEALLYPDLYPGEADDAPSFENFIYNRKNEFALSAAKNFAAGGQQGLFTLFGGSSSGKSHLLRAIHAAVRRNVPEKFIIIKPLMELETFFSNSFKNGESPLLYFRNFKYILIDDLDMAESRPLLQEQLVTLMEYARECRINMAVTLRQKPGSLSLMSEKLRSLLESGLIIELKKPDLDIRRQYAEHTASVLNLQLKKDDALALARMYSGFRQIHGALIKASSYLVLSPQAAEAKLSDILQSSISESQKTITPDHIINSAAEYFGLTPRDITGKKRLQSIVFARHVAMYLCRDILRAQFGHIGACFSDRDHSSVLYSVNKIKNLMKSDKDTHTKVTEVKNMILK